MISLASNENGVRLRVTACRKRLRNSRATHRATNHIQLNKQRQVVTISASALTDKSAEIFARSVDHTWTARVLITLGARLPGEDGDREEVGLT